MTILELMLDHHRQCDDSFTQVENLVAKKDWSNTRAFEDFLAVMARHFQAEEDVLFAALERKVGEGMGPVVIMRQEHQQMSILMDQMKDAFAARDQTKFLSLSDTWMMLTQQHNMKEEEVLYPMMDDLLAQDGAALINQAQEVLYKQP
jgi:hemerythrin-like domain-containing protein